MYSIIGEERGFTQSRRNSIIIYPTTRAGGVETFRSGESRMPGEGDDDSEEKKKINDSALHYNLLFTVYTLTGFVILFLAWFNVFTLADVVRTGESGFDDALGLELGIYSLSTSGNTGRAQDCGTRHVVSGIA
ncbi:hypothetical protein F5887DRAFT_90750 [Amanita rubescens]|nr:hypothetical protein F5887DRAFT_90750 [Amanita rubescens]